jgi:hypothetical protein
MFKGKMLEMSSVLILSAMTLACSDATAMSRTRVEEQLAPAPAAQLPLAQDENRLPPLEIERLSAGTYQQGLQLGRRNGDILVNRLRLSTLGTRNDCRRVDDFQEALVKVTRGVRPPANSEDALVAGFYRGYIDSVRKAIRDARTGCGIRHFSSGAYAGQLYGALVCQVSTISVEAVNSLQLESLYEGWSGGSSVVVDECRSSASVTVKDCAGELNDSITIQIEQSCSDLDL